MHKFLLRCNLHYLLNFKKIKYEKMKKDTLSNAEIVMLRNEYKRYKWRTVFLDAAAQKHLKEYLDVRPESRRE